jgi:hypothetical protein
VDHYHALPEQIYFAQGDPFTHAPDFLQRIKHKYDVPTSLTAKYSDGYPPEETRCHDRVETVHGHEVRYGLATAAGQFPGAGTDLSTWLSEVWSHVFAGPVPSPFRFGYSAHWALPREAILRRPLSVWAWLLAEAVGPAGRSKIDRGSKDHPLTPWAYEAVWAYLFSDPKDYPTRARGTVEESPRQPPKKGCGCGNREALRKALNR